jgi:multicomponent Na+:H+ antiporter subunit G
MKRLIVAFAVTLPASALAAPGAAAASLRPHPVAQALILFGAVFILAAALGMLRFPDFYTRLHASTKLVTLGGLGILGGAALTFSSMGTAERVLLIAAFFLLTAPLSGYMIAHAGYLSGAKPYREDSSVDEWQACGAAVEGLESASEADQRRGDPNG